MNVASAVLRAVEILGEENFASLEVESSDGAVTISGTTDRSCCPLSTPLAGSAPFVEQLLSRDLLIGPMVVHPVEMVPAGFPDSLRLPCRKIVLLDVLGHELRVDLVDVLEAHYYLVVDLLRVGRLLGCQPEADHGVSPASSYA